MTLDSRFRVAAVLVRDAIEARQPDYQRIASMVSKYQEEDRETLAGRTLRRCISCDDPSLGINLLQSRLYRVFVQLVAIVHCMLMFWEHVPGTAGSPAFSWGPGLVELACIGVYCLDQGVRLRLRGPSMYLDKKWEGAFAVAALAAAVDWVLFYPLALRHVFRFASPLRPMLFIAKKSAHRRMLASVLRTIPRIFDITALLCVVLGFYAVLGQQLFSDALVPEYTRAWDNFNTFGNGALAMFIVKSSENYPDILYQAMPSRPIIALVFYISAVYVLFWFVLPLFLSVVYDYYQEVHRSQAAAKRLKSYPPLVLAYQVIMQGDGDGEMNYDLLREFLPYVSVLYDTSAVARPVFKALDVDGDGDITILEWLHLPAALKLGAVQASASIGADSEDEDSEEEEEEEEVRAVSQEATPLGTDPSDATPRAVHFAAASPATAHSAAPVGSSREVLGGTAAARRRALRRAVAEGMAGRAWYRTQGACCSTLSRFKPYRMVVSQGTAILIGLIVTLWDEASTSRYRHCLLGGHGAACVDWGQSWYPLLSCVLMVVSVADLVVRAVGSRGGVAAWWHASHWHKLDVVLVLWTAVSEWTLLFCLIARTRVSFTSMQVLQVARAARMLRFITVFKRFRHFLDSLGSVIIVTFRMTVIYCGITYAFATVGFPMFQNIPATAGEATGVDSPREWDYSTFGSTLLVLLQLTVGNNINDNIYTGIYGRSRWYALYYVAYFFLCATVIFEIVVGVTIELYVAAQEQRAVDEQARAMVRAAKKEDRAAKRAARSASVTEGGAAAGPATRLGAPGGPLPPARPSVSSMESEGLPAGGGIHGFKPLAVKRHNEVLSTLAAASAAQRPGGGGSGVLAASSFSPPPGTRRTRAATGGDLGVRAPLLPRGGGGVGPPPPPPRPSAAPQQTHPEAPASPAEAPAHGDKAAFSVDFVGALTGGSLLGAASTALHGVISPDELRLLESALATQERALLGSTQGPARVPSPSRDAGPPTPSLGSASASFWAAVTSAPARETAGSGNGTELGQQLWRQDSDSD